MEWSIQPLGRNKNDTANIIAKRTSETSWIPVVGDTAENPHQYRVIKKIDVENIPRLPPSIYRTIDRL